MKKPVWGQLSCRDVMSVTPVVFFGTFYLPALHWLGPALPPLSREDGGRPGISGSGGTRACTHAHARTRMLLLLLLLRGLDLKILGKVPGGGKAEGSYRQALRFQPGWRRRGCVALSRLGLLEERRLRALQTCVKMAAHCRDTAGSHRGRSFTIKAGI